MRLLTSRSQEQGGGSQGAGGRGRESGDGSGRAALGALPAKPCQRSQTPDHPSPFVQRAGLKPALQGITARAAFTMVEIAIALGVIAFALVAIIGILPMGLQVQRDNLAETIVNQDATFWLDAIKSGARGMDELTNLVDRIDIHYNFDDPPRETYETHSGFRDGWEIIGLLSTPARTNAEVFASVWAVSGTASEKEPNMADRAVAFKYRMRIQIEPGPANTRSFTDTTIDPTAAISTPLTSLYDIRLTLGYPLVGEVATTHLRDQTPPRAQTYRTATSRRVLVEDVGGTVYTFFAQ